MVEKHLKLGYLEAFDEEEQLHHVISDLTLASASWKAWKPAPPEWWRGKCKRTRRRRWVPSKNCPPCLPGGCDLKAFKECIQTQSEAPDVIGRHIFIGREEGQVVENDRVQNLSWILRNQVAVGTIRMAKMKLLDHVKWYSWTFGLILFVFLEKVASETNRFNRPAISEA